MFSIRAGVAHTGLSYLPIITTVRSGSAHVHAYVVVGSKTT